MCPQDEVDRKYGKGAATPIEPLEIAASVSRPGPIDVSHIPQGAVDLLRDMPELHEKFDDKYGPGAAEAALAAVDHDVVTPIPERGETSTGGLPQNIETSAIEKKQTTSSWSGLERWIRLILAAIVTLIGVWAMTSMFSRHDYEIALSIVFFGGIYFLVVYSLLRGY